MRFLLAFLLFSSPALAQTVLNIPPRPCDTRENVLRQFNEKHSEWPREIGATAAGLVEVWYNDARSTWTITLTMPNGMTCLILSGEYWEILPRTFEGDPA